MTSESNKFEGNPKSASELAHSGDTARLTRTKPEEYAALRPARCSDHFPYIIRCELIKELAVEFTATQIIELAMALAVTGISQRRPGIYGLLSSCMLADKPDLLTTAG